MKKCKIKSVKSIGIQSTYNVTMASDSHNYAIYGSSGENKLFTKNSHSLGYGWLSYQNGFLKAHYTEEFLCSCLNVFNGRKDHDKIIEFERDLKNFNIILSAKDLNTCGVDYKIIRKRDEKLGIKYSEISPSLMVKGLGKEVALDIEKNQPYKDLRDFAIKTDFTIVGKDAIECLWDAGYFDSMKKKYDKKNKNKDDISREKLVEKFVGIRQDLKSAIKKGVASEDLFS